ncbi:hypothetical protein [Allorhizobium terrae]|uniref:Uncharacterized protein n=1 Tax=Allorhizobium terrae TaxID=1848972 RepID=A0A4S4A594_9HYPH|nr:hypothetical protein [Allorhizobium terrae]THF53655.1 hypothetical protein E6C51_00565 [Allorhizobium terrae]
MRNFTILCGYGFVFNELLEGLSGFGKRWLIDSAQKPVVFVSCIRILSVYVAIYPYFAGQSKYQINFVVFCFAPVRKLKHEKPHAR